MKAQDLIGFWKPMIEDANNSWSIGTFGASAEFHRETHEASKRFDTANALAIATEKGGMRLVAKSDLEPVAFDNLNSDGETWSHSVVFCEMYEPKAPQVVAVLGEDREAIREEDKSAKLFDIGVGLGLVRMCVRTRDEALIKALDARAGKPLFGPENGDVMHALFSAQPHRVMLSPAARIEVYQDIPPPDGNSPEGPHTHLMPKLLAKQRTHSANTPIPEGLQPVLNFHPKSPWRDGLGKRTPFNTEADAAFEAWYARYASPADRAIRASVEAAVSAGVKPADFAWPQTRRGRTEARIALRRLAVRGANTQLAAWQGTYDRAPVVDADEETADAHA